jgi:Co/Zn/Cd efflux system component
MVLVINLAMFILELTAGLVGHSSSLLADSLDSLGDAITYALSLYVVYRSPKAKARVAMFKGFLILIAGLFVLYQVTYRLIMPSTPLFELMGIMGLVALFANGCCLFLLWKHKEDDVNMSSVWHCSRNDIASNLSVLIATGFVYITNSGWPDLLIGFGLAILFLISAIKVIKVAYLQLG